MDGTVWASELRIYVYVMNSRGKTGWKRDPSPLEEAGKVGYNFPILGRFLQVPQGAFPGSPRTAHVLDLYNTCMGVCSEG